VMGLLFYEHSIVSPKDMSRLNAAFFTLNGIISVLFFCFVAMAVTFRH
jgi:4-hydroxybenzoate polyprenyltransferase